MRHIYRTIFAATALAGFVLSAPAFADEHGKGKGRDNDRGHGQSESRNADEGRGGVTVNVNFRDDDRRVIQEYYGEAARSGHCPPGLRKKDNGCMPPGQAKRWQVGRPLPRDVVFYELPPTLVTRIAPPPPGYRYVRVAADVLMIAAGIGIVASALEDLARQ